ncbi:MAG: beta-phosphoglucomutase [Rickettsiales bacterium]
MTYQAFIFDLDGVITDTALHHFRAWKMLADRLSIPFDEHDNEKLKGVGRMESLDLILEKGKQTFSLDEKIALTDKKNADYLELIKSITPADILPGVTDAFAILKQKKIRIGLASASKNATFVVDRLGMLDQFDYIADAAKIPRGKPAPDIFLDVAKAFGLSSDACVGVEDAAAGVDAIKSAKMFAVGIGEPEVLAKADLIFPSMRAFDVERILASYSRKAS